MKPISQTAFYCCGVRMQDAEREQPVCADVYAKVFMNEDGLKILEKFKDETRPNQSNVARHRIIDDLLRQELATHPDLCVVIVGAGFDSRAYRLNGGTWFELDEPQVIAYKNERLPVSASQNEHKLICDLTTRKFFEKYGRQIHEKLTGMGAVFKFTADNPEEIFVKNGYQRVDQISMVEKSMEFEGKKIPKILFRTLLRTLASGYAIYVFEAK